MDKFVNEHHPTCLGTVLSLKIAIFHRTLLRSWTLFRINLFLGKFIVFSLKYSGHLLQAILELSF